MAQTGIGTEDRDIEKNELAAEAADGFNLFDLPVLFIGIRLGMFIFELLGCDC